MAKKKFIAKYADIIQVPGRLSYPKLMLSAEEKAAEDAKSEFATKTNTVDIIVKEADSGTIKLLKSTILDLTGAKKLSELEHHPIKNGADKPDSEGYENSVFFKAASEKKIDFFMRTPKGQIVAVEKEDVREVFYGGANCIFLIKFSEYKEGEVTAYLHGILRVNDEGQPFGNAVNAKAIFQQYAVADAEEEEEDEDESEEEEEVVAPKKGKVAKKVVIEDEEDADEDEEEEEEEEEVAPKKAAKKGKRSMSAFLD